MTVEEVKARVAHIEAISGDDESAHSEEDGLREAVLRAIASGDLERTEMVALAVAALATSDIEFARWCA